jgi:hypothetical protein
MDTSLFALRRVKYKPLSTLLNRKLTISSLDRIETDVLAAVSSELSGLFHLTSLSGNLEVMFAKYGFLDLDFVTSGSAGFGGPNRSQDGS